MCGELLVEELVDATEVLLVVGKLKMGLVQAQFELVELLFHIRALPLGVRIMTFFLELGGQVDLLAFRSLRRRCDASLVF